MTIIEAIMRAAELLAAQGIENARLDAEVLLGNVLAKDRAWLVAHYPDDLDSAHLRSFDATVERRAKREPLQYITGVQEFWGLPFMVTPAVLIPRPETEFVVEAALNAAGNMRSPVEPLHHGPEAHLRTRHPAGLLLRDYRGIVIDLCTGSGCIAVSLASELPQARIFATDRSGAALEIARQNARLNNAADRIRFLEGDLFGPLEEMDLTGRVDVITANPPYVRTNDRAELQHEVRDFEPEVALIAGPEGTEVAERIIAAAPHYLRPGGSLILEMGLGQAGALRRIVAAAGRYGPVEVLKDLAGIERVIVTKKK